MERSQSARLHDSTRATDDSSTSQRKNGLRLGLPTALLLGAVLSAGAFAAGRASTGAAGSASTTGAVVAPSVAPEPAVAQDQGSGMAWDEPADTNALPPGHPAIGASDGLPSGTAGAAAPSLEWTAPPRWQLMPNASAMRIATYRVPALDATTPDAELSITQAGGSVDANAERWIAQFDEAARRSAKRTTRKVGALEITIVEVEGTFSAGMGKSQEAQQGWALLGAIASTPGMPHFFKLTGPAKAVKSARAEFDGLVGTLTAR